MKKIITLMCSCLLLSTQVMADRPAMSERSTEPEAVDNVEEAASAPSAVELDMQQQQSIPIQTGNVLEIQPGATLSIRELDFPRRGMTMYKVQNEMGVPVTVSDTIGKPPITSWTYPDRIVYFEHSTVVHVVATR